MPSPRALCSAVFRRPGRVSCVRVRAGVCGVDLGTSNSAVAVLRPGRQLAAVLHDRDGQKIVPSVVHFASDGSVLVGADAVEAGRSDPANTFHSIKRFIGLSMEEVKREAQLVPFEVADDGDGGILLHAPNLEEPLRPQEVSARVLRALFDRYERVMGEAVDKVVVTVPAYFNDRQRAATEEAARLAGVEKVRLLREPIAAALAYGAGREEEERVLVFDLGGGTFDVSVVDVGGDTVEVIATGGDAHLGGDDLDQRIAKFLAKEARAAGVRDGAKATLLLPAARAAREHLSQVNKTRVHVPSGMVVPFGEGEADVPEGGALVQLTKNHLLKVLGPELKRMRLPLERCALSAGLDLQALQERAARKSGGAGAHPFAEVLLVGGATRTPAVRTFVENVTGRKPRPKAVNPDEAVAAGAALQAAIYEGELETLYSFDAFQSSLMRAIISREMRGSGEFDEEEGEWEEEEEEGEWAEEEEEQLR
mmetsp:Transcript_8502/g.28167  ORF Transcript_8502/g.28167 Transcript_8502/m.28167 type:complete len:480 (+) Transcript_8502:73-1512(+)